MSENVSDPKWHMNIFLMLALVVFLLLSAVLKRTMVYVDGGFSLTHPSNICIGMWQDRRENKRTPLRSLLKSLNEQKVDDDRLW